MALGDARVTADGVVLVRHPDEDNHVERGGAVVEELRHDGFHACKG